MLRFNTDPGIARRLICMEFNSRFAEPDEYEKEKEEFKDRNVFVKDKDIILFNIFIYRVPCIVYKIAYFFTECFSV